MIKTLKKLETEKEHLSFQKTICQNSTAVILLNSENLEIVLLTYGNHKDDHCYPRPEQKGERNLKI